MRKVAYFATHWGPGWPDLNWLQAYFVPPPGKLWSPNGDSDSGSLALEGADSTAHLSVNSGRIDIRLRMWRNPELGILLIYSKWGGGFRSTYSSKGDASRLREWVRTTHQDLLPVGLFIPYESAWKAVKEFIETGGELPKSIDWIANRDLPPGSFPAPHEMK